MTAHPRAKPDAVLVSHRRVAALHGVSTTTFRRWVERGDFAAAHSTVGTMLFYRADDVRKYLETGQWPKG